MAGSAAAYQVELLRNDIEDVHSVILDVLSRVGPLQQTSWKYPDRNGYEIDVADLLNKYQLTDDEGDELIIQTALLELLVDRFLLLFHALGAYVEQRSSVAPPTDRDGKMSFKSAGHTARQYWRKIGAIISFVNEIQNSLTAKDEKIAQLESASPKKTEASKPAKPPVPEKLMSADFKIRKADISAETSVRGTQTLETAFRPCESCAVVQDGLRSVLDCVSTLVVNQNVPSSVAKFKKTYDGMAWLSAADLQRLVPELSCDLDKIQRQWSWLFSQIEPLRSEIDKLTKELDHTKHELQQKKSDLATIHALHAKALKEAETKWASLDKESQAKIGDLRQRIDKLSADKEQLMDQVQSLQSVVEEKQQLLEDFQRLQSNLDGLSEESQVIKEHLVTMTKDRDSLRNALQMTKEELNRSTMLAESMRSRCEGLQSKQDSLLQQMSDMDRCSDEYRIKMSNLEGQLEATRDHLDDKRREMEQLKQDKLKLELEVDQLKRQQSRPASAAENSRHKQRSKEESPRYSNLQSKVATLQDELTEFRHKEMLLLAFPDPNGPLPYAEPSGDICVDLERQITATDLRSQLLQNQAAQLEKSLKKLKEAKGGGGGMSVDVRNTKSEGGPRPTPREVDEEDQEKTPGSGKLFSKRSTTFVVRPSEGGKLEIEPLQEADQLDNSSGSGDAMKQKLQELQKIRNELPHFNKGSNGGGDKPVQLWRVPTLKEEEDPVVAAICAYNNQNEAILPQTRNRSNSYGRPDPKVKHETLPQLPVLPPGSSKPPTNASSNATSASLIQRAMNRQVAMTAELKLKSRVSSAGKQRPPQHPLSSPTSQEQSGGRLNWDLYSCSRCAKTYSNQRDLDIHMAYCSSEN